MLWIIALTLVALWVFGMAADYTGNGFVHVLLAVALLILVVRMISGHRRL